MSELKELVDKVEEAAFPPTPNAQSLIDAANATTPSTPSTSPPESSPQPDPAPPPPMIPPGIVSEGGGGGSAFDPAIHESEDGKPVLNSDGTLRKKRGRKPTRGPDGKFGRSEPPQTTVADNAGGGGLQPPPQERVTRDAAMKAASASVTLGVGFAVGVLGEEWLCTKEEAEGLIASIGEYFYAEQIAGLTPGWIALASVIAYAAPRIPKPKTQSRLKLIWAKVKGLMGRR